MCANACLYRLVNRKRYACMHEVCGLHLLVLSTTVWESMKLWQGAYMTFIIIGYMHDFHENKFFSWGHIVKITSIYHWFVCVICCLTSQLTDMVMLVAASIFYYRTYNTGDDIICLLILYCIPIILTAQTDATSNDKWQNGWSAVIESLVDMATT